MATVTAVLAEKTDLKIALVPTDSLKPHEKGSPLYLEILKKQIVKDSFIRFPVVADEETGVIYDGMHRWLALKSLGYKFIPAILVSPEQRERIRVGTRRVHRYGMLSEQGIPVRKVLSAGLKKKLMDPRTTRHFFPFSKSQKVNIPLEILEKCPPQDVSKHLSEMSMSECRLAIAQWLEEINEELEFLTKRKLEAEQEKQEFLARLANA